ncbi:methyltransferase, putative [Entamoeba histolytica HM-1:IMSS-B]|uniref:tRNA (guanine(46)-N(7))-methyltransferase n=6 Tax=Entamoeba histolytica TaxID=5759 RepID=B1N3S7_ENTH1|nr:hypothetical protein EHI_128170 [Entamoeba histolytica HM-1:IMSS]EMD44433.1 methyltransferase, putative [Entamoeba histolytica KU27]EMH75101.1 methyltransferase, putative [Entamoeba histolytica HM-1:IMSS-B]EMS12827.1 methyltransferase [Entamoeba histolytica HM-3:IMSS]ENY63317.1 methyltransferase, putative [Entamoeba histolytica HM-1:IMSS-A]GAT96508.1 hypothetical protein CL6EHI_128170 [Entamoeba histolytica]|eukprot:XP_001913841.1 hypothetical protein EHI_128170 [Entamoeba histolytica HM-1:IMSS]
MSKESTTPNEINERKIEEKPHKEEKKMKKQRYKKEEILGNPLEEYFEKVSKNVAPYNPIGRAEEEIEEGFSQKSIFYINKLFADAAQERNYGKVIYLYKKLIESGIKEDLHTITNIINSAARVGDGILVDKTWIRMKQLGLKANEVTRTVSVKGYFAAGLVEKAMYTYYCMDNRNNIRSINAAIRGLLRLGNSKQIHTFTKHPINAEDMTTKEYLTALYSIEQEISLVRKIMESINNEDEMSATSLINLATLNCLIGDVETGDLLLKEFEDISKRETDARKSIRLFKKHQVAQLRNRRKHIRTFILNTQPILKEQRKKYSFSQAKEVFQMYPREINVLHFEEVFKNKNPINIELCSGYGEWLITKAEEKKDENWVGVELYRDRVYNSWATKVFAGLDNVACVWGDAMNVLMLNIMADSIDNIYLNFPEPPKYENSPTNLFTIQFFFQVARILKLDGVFCLLTDSPIVVNIVNKQFAHSEILRNKFQIQGKTMFEKKLPEGYGTSYFDQLWKNGKINQDRFFMKIKKIM